MWWICADVSLLHLKEGKFEEEDMVVEERYLLQSGMPAIDCFCAEDLTETLTLFWIDVVMQVLQEFQRSDPKR